MIKQDNIKGNKDARDSYFVGRGSYLVGQNRGDNDK